MTALVMVILDPRGGIVDNSDKNDILFECDMCIVAIMNEFKMWNGMIFDVKIEWGKIEWQNELEKEIGSIFKAWKVAGFEKINGMNLKSEIWLFVCKQDLALFNSCQL